MVDSVNKTSPAAGAALPFKDHKPVVDSESADKKGQGGQTPAAIVAMQAKGAGERRDVIRSYAAAETETHRVAGEIIANPLKSLDVHELNPARVERLTNDEA